jgi:hypothetical protein
MKFITVIAIIMLAFSGQVFADPPGGFGSLYYEGDIVRTLVPPAAAPMQGRDNVYPIVPWLPSLPGIAITTVANGRFTSSCGRPEWNRICSPPSRKSSRPTWREM